MAKRKGLLIICSLAFGSTNSLVMESLGFLTLKMPRILDAVNKQMENGYGQNLYLSMF